MKPTQNMINLDKAKSPRSKVSIVSQTSTKQVREPFLQTKNKNKNELQLYPENGMLKGNKSEIFKNQNYGTIKVLRQIKKTICPQ